VHLRDADTFPRVNLISEVQVGGGVPLYQLKITLKGSKPPIWRRVVVRADMTLDRLHHVIQIAMGWTNSHLHQFIAGSGLARAFYGRPDPEFAEMGSETLNEKRFTVADLAPAAKRRFTYEYDFGDGWQHDILAEKILSPNPGFKHPACLAGANACPPEDCGGIGGYYNLLKILADPKHPEHSDMTDWIGGELNTEEFSVEGVNAVFKRLKA
jgi:pRiA4b ORF-3-like protein